MQIQHAKMLLSAPDPLGQSRVGAERCFSDRCLRSHEAERP